MVALVHLCYYCDRLVAVTLDLPTTTCYSDTSITTARRGPVAPDALRLAHILTVLAANWDPLIAALLPPLLKSPLHSPHPLNLCGDPT